MKKLRKLSNEPALEGPAAASPGNEPYLLRLYVTGMTPRSTEAFSAIKAVCEEHLKGRYALEVVDIYQHPEMAEGERLVAAPTLVRKLPLPERRLVGGFSDRGQIRAVLDLENEN